MVGLVIAACALTWLTLVGLSTYTHHGESITVPDLRGMTMDQVEQHLKSKSLRYTIIDSSYLTEKLPETVLDQNPRPGEKVKESRRIYLTINATDAPLVKIPNIINASLRNAEVQLKSMGLNLGELEYVPDIAKAVLSLKVNGKDVAPNDEVHKGTPITLVMGNGLGDTKIHVPLLVGLTFHEAKLALRALSLNVGAVVMEGEIANKESAEVYFQSPEQTEEGDKMITIGEPVDLFLQKRVYIPEPPPAPTAPPKPKKTKTTKEDTPKKAEPAPATAEKTPAKDDKKEETDKPKKKPLVTIKKN